MSQLPFFRQMPDQQQGSRPVVVFLHGLFGDLGNFEQAARAIQPHFPVLVPELPLFNAAAVSPALPDLLDWLDDLLNRFENARFVLVGNSLGGQLACLYASLKPERIHALVLTGAAGMGESGLGTSRPRRFDPAFIREKARLTFYRMEPDDALVSAILNVVGHPESLRRLLALSRDSMRTRLDHVLPAISCPVQLVWGKNDRITPLESCLAFQRLLPHARTVLFDACGHAPMMEKPDAFSRVVLDFLVQTSDQPSTLSI